MSDRWTELLAAVDDLSEETLGLDPGIRNVVAGLWGHGVDTLMSCEGHDAGPTPMPWVSIGVDLPFPNGLLLTSIGADGAFRWQAETLEMLAKAAVLLAGFFEHHPYHWQRSLRLKTTGEWSFGMIETAAENDGRIPMMLYANGLAEFTRGEMAAFGLWLRDTLPPDAGLPLPTPNVVHARERRVRYGARGAGQ